MKSFLQQIEEAFEAIDKTDAIVDDIANRHDNIEDELEEASTSGGAGAYMTPNAFSPADDDTVEALGYKRVRESVRKPANYKHGIYQSPESAEETYSSKFAYSKHDQDWQHAKYHYPSVPFAKSYEKYDDRSADIKEKYDVKYDWSGIEKSSKSEEILESKYEQLIESYRSYKTASGDKKPSRTIKETITDIARRLKEIEEAVNHASRFKNEAGVTSSAYGPSTTRALTKISERLIKISERVRTLGE
jgi:hypothetical protein